MPKILHPRCQAVEERQAPLSREKSNMRRLEPEEEMNSPKGQGDLRHMASSLPVSAELSEIALASMQKSFAERDHSPSIPQWEALKEVVRNVEQMADGALEESVYLSNLDPGVGKTQSIIHSVRALLEQFF
jgi:hypothetical protein